MADSAVGPGEEARLGRVDGDLKVGHNATIKAESGGKIVVTGSTFFDGGANIDCSFESNAVEVQARRHTGGTIRVLGDFTVHQAADIADSLEVAGAATADGFDVGGHLTSRSVASRRVRVGGHVRVSGVLEAESVESGGHLSALGLVKLANLRAGGHVEIGGGTISGSIRLRGHFTAKSALDYGELQAYGHVILPAHSKGDLLSVFGRVGFGGDTFCRVIDVKGVGKVAGDCNAESVEVSGKLNVSGSLNVSRDLKIFGTTEGERQVRCDNIILGGRLSADSVLVDGEADIDGEVRSSRGLKAKSVLVRRGSKVVGPLVGEQVDIGKAAGAWRFPLGGRLASSGRNTSVADVHGGVVRMGPFSRARLIFAEVLEMDDGSHADQATYTETLKLRMNNLLNKPSVKTSELPEPPL